MHWCVLIIFLLMYVLCNGWHLIHPHFCHTDNPELDHHQRNWQQSFNDIGKET